MGTRNRLKAATFIGVIIVVGLVADSLLPATSPHWSDTAPRSLLLGAICGAAGVIVQLVFILRDRVRTVRDLKNLTVLDLSNTDMTDAGLNELIDLKYVTSLDLSGTKITDAGLTTLKCLESLMTLKLRNTAITDSGLKALAAIKNLAWLDVRNTKATDAGLKALTGSLPNVWIERMNDDFSAGDSAPDNSALAKKGQSDTVDHFVIIACPQCHTRVVPKRDGTCPACQRTLNLSNPD